MVLPPPFCDIYKQTGNHPTPWVNLILLWIAELWLVHSGLPVSSSVLTCHTESIEKTPRLEMDWTSPSILCNRVSAGFLWIWPRKAPSISFQEFQILPWEKHQFSWHKARVWALLCWLWEMVPRGHLHLGIVMLLIAWERSNCPPWERQACSPMEMCFRRWDEVLDLSPRKEAPDAYLSNYYQSLNLLVPEQQANPSASRVPGWVVVILALWVARYKCKRGKKVKCLKHAWHTGGAH